MIDTAKIKANILSCAFKGMLVDFNVEKSNKALDELHKENKKYVPVKEDEYLTEVPSRWQWSRLGYVTNNHGQKEPQEDFCYIDVGTLDNINHCLAKKENLVNKEEAPSRARKIVEQGDVLYSTVRPYLHNICIINKDFSRMPVASTAFCVMAVEEKVLINKYLFYWLLSPEFDKFSNGNPSKGTLYPAIGEKDLLNGVIPIPDIEEQKLIVEKLDSAFEHLDKLNRLQTQYSSDLEVLKSKIIDAGIQGKLTEQLPEDGTAEELLEQIAEEKKQLIKEKKIKSSKALPEITEDEIPFTIPNNWKFVRIGDVCEFNPKNDLSDDLEVSFIPMACVTEGYNNKHSFEIRKWGEIKKGFNHFQNNDVGVAKITPCFQNRKSVVFRDLLEGYGAGTTELSIVRGYEGMICPDYLLWFFKSVYFISNGIESFTGVVGQQRIHKDYLKMCVLPLPPYLEQLRIADKINSAIAAVVNM